MKKSLSTFTTRDWFFIEALFFMHPQTETVLLFLLIVNKLLHLSSPNKAQKYQKSANFAILYGS